MCRALLAILVLAASLISSGGCVSNRHAEEGSRNGIVDWRRRAASLELRKVLFDHPVTGQPACIQGWCRVSEDAEGIHFWFEDGQDIHQSNEGYISGKLIQEDGTSILWDEKWRSVWVRLKQ